MKERLHIYLQIHKRIIHSPEPFIITKITVHFVKIKQITNTITSEYNAIYHAQFKQRTSLMSYQTQNPATNMLAVIIAIVAVSHALFKELVMTSTSSSMTYILLIPFYN